MATDIRKTRPPNPAIAALAEANFNASLGGNAIDAWSSSAQKLLDSKTSSASLKTYAQSCAEILTSFGASTLGATSETVDHLRLKAGIEAAKSLVTNLSSANMRLPDAESFEIWLGAICTLADIAPTHVAEVCAKTHNLLSKLDAIGFSRWVSTGITSSAGDANRIDRYFALKDPASREILELEASTVRLAEIEMTLASLPLGLWNQRIIIRAAGFTTAETHLRTSFDDRFIRVPMSFDDVRGSQAEDLFKAAITHVGAHIEFSGPRRKPKALKPIQLALISILEDSRAELLAARKYPGLLRLWQSFHTVTGRPRPIEDDDQNCACHVVSDSTPVTENLLERLSRSLIDEQFQDDNPWVLKGRKLFFDAGPDWNDPEDLRRIGVLLGNDLGQMRLQFNAKTYVVKPPYRDDNLGLWDFGDPPDEAADELDTVTASVRIQREEQETAEETLQLPEDEEVSASNTPVQPDDDVGIPICKLPEWDYLAGSLRPNWVTIVEQKPLTAPAHIIADRLNKHAAVAARIDALVRQSKIGQTKRLKRQREGDRLDLDACIQNRIDVRTGHHSDIGVYETTAFSQRDLSVLVLLDISESTKDLINGTPTSVFHLERDATALLAHAMDSMGDPFAIHAFCSNGRAELRYHHIKNFGAPYNDIAKSHLAGMRPGLSTRMGGALRYAGSMLSEQTTTRKLILLVTDGEPSDIDVSDPSYLLEDSRKAVVELAGKGVDVFAVGLVGTGQSELPRIFGQRNTVQIDRLESLPERLPMLYFRLVG